MKHIACETCKCNTCQDGNCKSESCNECCLEGNKVNPVLGDCHGYSAPENVKPLTIPSEPISAWFNKLLVINGLYYAGMSNDLSNDRSDAVVIKSKDALYAILGAVLSSVMQGKLALKRIEVIKVKEVPNEPPMPNLLQGTNLPMQNLS